MNNEDVEKFFKFFKDIEKQYVGEQVNNDTLLRLKYVFSEYLKQFEPIEGIDYTINITIDGNDRNKVNVDVTWL